MSKIKRSEFEQQSICSNSPKDAVNALGKLFEQIKLDPVSVGEEIKITNKFITLSDEYVSIAAGTSLPAPRLKKTSPYSKGGARRNGGAPPQLSSEEINGMISISILTAVIYDKIYGTTIVDWKTTGDAAFKTLFSSLVEVVNKSSGGAALCSSNADYIIDYAAQIPFLAGILSANGKLPSCAARYLLNQEATKAIWNQIITLGTGIGGIGLSVGASSRYGNIWAANNKIMSIMGILTAMATDAGTSVGAIILLPFKGVNGMFKLAENARTTIVAKYGHNVSSCSIESEYDAIFNTPPIVESTSGVNNILGGAKKRGKKMGKKSGKKIVKKSKKTGKNKSNKTRKKSSKKTRKIRH